MEDGSVESIPFLLEFYEESVLLLVRVGNRLDNVSPVPWLCGGSQQSVQPELSRGGIEGFSVPERPLDDLITTF